MDRTLDAGGDRAGGRGGARGGGRSDRIRFGARRDAGRARPRLRARRGGNRRPALHPRPGAGDAPAVHRVPGRTCGPRPRYAGTRARRDGLSGRLQPLCAASPRGRRVTLAGAHNLLISLHIIFVIAWMAGLLYLPRLYAYHTRATPGSEMAGTFQTMEV